MTPMIQVVDELMTLSQVLLESQEMEKLNKIKKYKSALKRIEKVKQSVNKLLADVTK